MKLRRERYYITDNCAGYTPIIRVLLVSAASDAEAAKRANSCVVTKQLIPMFSENDFRIATGEEIREAKYFLAESDKK